MITRKEAKEFVIKTLKQGDRERIQKVLKRYFEYIKSPPVKDIVKEAKEIFGVKTL